MVEMQQPDNGASRRSGILSRTIHLAGAATSLALVIGIGLWGYKTVMRDVSGVPVVRAAVGPMRVAPADPGGRQTPYQGLSVNSVIAEDTGDAPPEGPILAPAPLDLSFDPAATSEDAAVRLARMQEVPETPAEGAPGLSEAPGTSATAATARVEGGLGRSLRPRLRPASLVTSPEGVALASLAGRAVRDVDPDSIAPGARLAQLGAFASREIAQREWERLAERFEVYLDGKARVIQKAESGGRSFYRLRAMGFEDINDARRFCSALVAEDVECIPVVAR